MSNLSGDFMLGKKQLLHTWRIIMKAIYVKEGKELKYYVHGLYDDKFNKCLVMAQNKKKTDKIDIKNLITYLQTNAGELNSLMFNDIETVSDSAFKNACGVKEVCFDESLKTVKKSAFENCEDLELFACEGTGTSSTENKNSNNTQKPVLTVENFQIPENVDIFTIEAFAFKKCKKLKTVILPKCEKLVIEKAAFEDCSSLRTVVCSAKEIIFTGNPFEDCPESLVFVCSKGSAIERFVRENGYRCVNA